VKYQGLAVSTCQRPCASEVRASWRIVLLLGAGRHVSIRLEEQRLCLLVMIGVRADGTKELIALADLPRVDRVMG
jgi:hypothetical protein